MSQPVASRISFYHVQSLMFSIHGYCYTSTRKLFLNQSILRAHNISCTFVSVCTYDAVPVHFSLMRRKRSVAVTSADWNFLLFLSTQRVGGETDWRRKNGCGGSEVKHTCGYEHRSVPILTIYNYWTLVQFDCSLIRIRLNNLHHPWKPFCVV